MTFRTITGEFRDITGELLANTTISVTPKHHISGDGSSVAILGDTTPVTSNGSGVATVNLADNILYEIEYTTSRGTQSREMFVDDEGPWTWGRLIGLAGTVSASLLRQTQDARDAALAAQDASETAQTAAETAQAAAETAQAAAETAQAAAETAQTGAETAETNAATSAAAAEADRILAEAAADDAVAVRADLDELRMSLFAVEQAVGCPDADMDAGTGSTGGGTYCFSTPIAEAGDDFTFTCYATSAGTIDLRFMSKSGDVFTVEASRQITVAVGVNTFSFDDLPYSAGWFAGFTTVSNRLGIEAGTDGYYDAPGQVIDTGQTFTDSTVSFAQFKARFDFTKQQATGPLAKQAYADIAELQNFVGVGTMANQTVGLSEGVTLIADGLGGIGGSYYIFEGEADVNRYLNDLDVYGEQAGTIQVQAWSVDGAGDVTLERQVGVTIDVGLNQIANVGLEVRAGERVGVFKGTGNIALNSAGANPTPYRSIASTSGTPSAISSSLRFEFRATLEPNTLDDRVVRLEGGDSDANLLPTHTFHALWLLGESHCAGRATTLSDAVIPAGKGYAYRRATGTMEHLEDPTGNDITAVSGAGRGSWGPRMGRMLLDITNGAIGGAVVNSGLGSTTIVSHWASGGSAWTTALADWADAKSEMDAMNKALAGVSVMIAIGSNDAAAGTAKATFKAAYLDLISRVRTELGYDVPILILPTGPFADGSDATEVAYIQDAQHEIAKETANCYIVTTATEYAADNGWFMDNVHFTQTGNEAIGAAGGALAFAVGSGNSV